MRLLGSFSFRLALIYAGLFTLSVAILLGLFYWSSIYRPMEAVRAGLRAESQRMEAVQRERGDAALAQLLERRAGAAAQRRPYHALLTPAGEILTTNLPSWPEGTNEPSWTDGTRQRWLRIEADIYRDGDEDDREALVLDRLLPDGTRLMVGRDINDLDDVEETILDAGIWLPPALLLLTILGGALMSRAIGRRIDTVGAAARRVMAGDLSERVPVKGTGDDLDRLGETLNAMLARIEDSVESVRRVSDSVAHELRTPLARLQADLAKLGDAPAAHRPALIASTAEEADRLGRMFDAVLRISRIETQRHAAEMRPLDLSALLDDAADYHAPQAEERGLAFEVRIASGLGVTGDRDLLFQAVSNLLDNAIKFTPEGDRVLLAAERAGAGVLVTIADTGPGVPAALRAKVTERFFRAPDARGVEGFGLGLALVQAVAERHGSTLAFRDGGPGLIVEWRFPQATGAASAASASAI
jgi:signal transduction histidine kinase